MKHIKIITSSALITLAAEELIARHHSRSFMAQVVRHFLPFIHAVPSIQTAADYQRALQKSKQPYLLPTLIQKTYHVHNYNGARDVLVINPSRLSNPNQVVFYLHGGGYFGQPFPQHFQLVDKLANQLGSRVIMPIYPKAPAHDALDTVAMVMRTYQRVHKSESARIILVGDSAGGGLVLSLMQQLRDQRLPLPERAVLLSPWLDVSNTNPKMLAVQTYDPVLNLANLTRLGRIYAKSVGTTDPLVSPIYGSLADLPPILTITGTADILAPDALKLQHLADINHWAVFTNSYHAMNHDFILFPIPEAKRALTEITDFIKDGELKF